MDPLSITAATVGINNFATSSIGQLRHLISGLAEAQDVLSDVSTSLANIERPLTALEQLNIPNQSIMAAAMEDFKKAGVAEAVNKCGETCSEFSKSLEKWTKHSSTTKFSLRDRLSIGVWNREKIRTLRMQLQSCEATVQFAVTSTQLMIQLRHEKTSEIDRERVQKKLEELETRIKEHLSLTEQQHDLAQTRKQELQQELEDEDDDGAQQNLAIQEVEKQSRVIEADQEACGIVFAQVWSRRSGQEIGKVLTSDNSRAFVGLPESVVGKINQRIGDVTTEKHSIAVVGVFRNDVNMSTGDTMATGSTGNT